MNLSEEQFEKKPKVFSPEEISAIPLELRKQLNLVTELPTTDSHISGEVMAKVRALAGDTPSGRDPAGFSWAALVYGPVYYATMKDWWFMVTSVLASIFLYTIPLLIPLAFFARKRAWASKRWESEEEFLKVQKKWDRSALVMGVISVVGLYFVSRFIFSSLTSTFGTSDPNKVLQQVQSQYDEIGQ